MSESFAELFEQSNIENKMRLGSIVTAKVVDITNGHVIVNAGLKSEGFIPAAQFLDDKGEYEVSIGDEVDVLLDAVEDGFGETKLSREKAKRLKIWENLKEAHESGAIVTGVISGRVKGGFNVNIDQVRAFLPGSLVDVRPVKDISELEGKPLEFKVIKIDQCRNNIVISRRAVLATESTANRAELINSLQEGAIIGGIVKNITDYGAFVDLGGIDGLLHITDMSWKRVKKPTEIVNVGDEIKVKVLQFDSERSRVSLGLKQMDADPWDNLKSRYPENTRLRGKVTNVADYGCFVELEEGIEGLVHVSEMTWTKKSTHPSRLIQSNQEVDVYILSIDTEKRRISLSMKMCEPNPWKQFAADHNKGDKVVGTVNLITDFGIFIGLEGDIDGLVHLSDISWAGNDEDCRRQYSKGDELEAVVLGIDVERERISLSIKQLAVERFTQHIDENPKGTVSKGTIKSINEKGVILTLAEGVDAYLRASEVSRDKKFDDIRADLKIGDEMTVKIIAVDRKKCSIGVSVKEKESDDEAVVVEEYGSSGQTTVTKSTLGDLFTKKDLDK